VAASPVGERKAQLYRDEAKKLWASLLNVPDVDGMVGDSIGQWLGTWFEENKPNAYIDEASVIGLMHENAHSVTIAGDLPAMAASVEVRAPFLDQELVQLAWRTHYRQKIKSIRNQNQNKWILKKALEGRVPHDLLYAAKRGFGYNIREEDVLRGPWKSKVDAAFANIDDLGGILNIDAVSALKTGFDRHTGVSAMLIAKLYAFLHFGNV
jgi:asparagine synthase (glutamine-hydrolysing)